MAARPDVFGVCHVEVRDGDEKVAMVCDAEDDNLFI